MLDKQHNQFLLIHDKLSCALLSSANSYNQERRGDFYKDYLSTDDDDFIDDDDHNYTSYKHKKKKEKNNTRKKKKKYNSKNKQFINSESSNEEDKEQADVKVGNSEKPSCRCSNSDNETPNNSEERNSALYSRRAAIKERTGKTKQLLKLQQLRKSKGLSLKQRALQSDDDDDNSENDDRDTQNPYQEHPSDREFIQDTCSSDDDTDMDEVDENNKKDRSFKLAGRVYMEESPAEENDVNDIPLDENEKSFFNAVRLNNTELVSAILERHRFVNILDEDRNTPIHVATRLRHVEIVKVLIDNEAKPNELNAIEQVPALAFAALNKDPGCLTILLDVTDLHQCDKSLIEHMDGRSLLHLIVEDNSNGKMVVDANNIHACLQILQKSDEKYLKNCLTRLDDLQGTPLVAAIRSDSHQVSLKYFLFFIQIWLKALDWTFSALN